MPGLVRAIRAIYRISLGSGVSWVVATVRVMSTWTRDTLCTLPSGTQDTSNEDEVNAGVEVKGTRLGVNRVLENSDNGRSPDE